MALTKQELSQTKNRNIDRIIGIKNIKRGIFSIRSDHFALGRRLTIQDSTDIVLGHPQSWPPRSLAVFWAGFPTWKISRFCLFENLHPGPPVTKHMLFPGKMQAVHIHNSTFGAALRIDNTFWDSPILYLGQSRMR